MSSDREAMSEHSLSIRLVVGDDKFYLSGYEPMAEDLAGFPKRESLAHSSEVEEEEKEEEEEAEVDEEEKDSSPLSQNFRSFILPSIWSVNDFIPKMSNDVFGKLCPYFQILDNIPIHMAKKMRNVTLEKSWTLTSMKLYLSQVALLAG